MQSLRRHVAGPVVLANVGGGVTSDELCLAVPARPAGGTDAEERAGSVDADSW